MVGTADGYHLRMTSPSSEDGADQSRFDRFEDLTRRLVAVPKEEADAEAKREKTAKRTS